MKMKKMLALVLSLCLLAFLLAACGNGNTTENDTPQTTEPTSEDPNGEDTPESSGPKTLRIGVESEIITLNPLECLDLVGSGCTINGELYESLFGRDENKDIVSWLASGYEWQDDTTLVVTLNEGITFHNGNEFTAEDVLFSLGLYAEDANFSERFAALDIENSYVEDDHTVVLKTTGFTTVLESALASYQVVMMDKEWYEENDGNIDRIANGTGPYDMAEWQNGVGIYMEANDNYWNGDTGYYDEVQVLFFSDATTAVLEYQTGTLDIVYVQNATDIETLMNGGWDSTQCVSVARHKLYTLTMCRYIGNEFADGTLCEAICYAIPVEELIQGALNGTMVAQDSVMPASDSEYVNVGFYDYDPERATELVEQYKTDNGVDEVTVTMVNVDSATMNALGEAIQGYLAEVGINMVLDIGQGSEVIPRFIAGEVNFTITSSGGGYDTCDAFTSIQRGSALMGELPSEEVLDMIEQAKVTEDAAERSELYAEIQQMVHDGYMVLPLCESYTYYAVRDGITMDLGGSYFPVCTDIYEN